MKRTYLLLLATLLLLPAAPARAHFLFVRVLPPAEGGRAAEVYFSELAEAGDPRFIEKVAPHTRLWRQTTPGNFDPLEAHKTNDRLRAWLPFSGSVMVVGECEYGVLGRGKTAFLLRHFPKAVAGNPEQLNKLVPFGKPPLEIVVSFEGNRVLLSALQHAKPLAAAEFIVIDATLKKQHVKADAAGKAEWKPAAPGNYSIYTRHTTKQAGEAGGKKYDEIRDFATVAFTWPLVRADADPEAVTRFEEAIAQRASWKGFPGFQARIAGNLDGRSFKGAVEVDAAGKVVYTDDDPSASEAVDGWLQDQLDSIVLHRLARSDARARAKPVIRFAESREDHPFGRLLIFEGGQFASSYRVKDKQVLVVNRHLGKENMTITVLENDRNADGLFLPRAYTVQTWDAANGALKRTETVQDRWTRVGSWDLPAQRTVTNATAAGLSTRSFALSKHELLKAK